MKKSNTKPLNLSAFLSFVFIVASIGVAAIKFTTMPPEYTVIIATLLLGAAGTLQCLNIQKRQEQCKALQENLGKLEVTASDD